MEGIKTNQFHDGCQIFTIRYSEDMAKAVKPPDKDMKRILTNTTKILGKYEEDTEDDCSRHRKMRSDLIEKRKKEDKQDEKRESTGKQDASYQLEADELDY